MPRSPKQQRSKATVDAIIKAGFICVADKGLAATTTRHIAKVAGVGVGSIYEYFEDKEAIYFAMSEVFTEDLAHMITDITPRLTEETIENALRILLENLKAFLQRDDSLYLRYGRKAASLEYKESQKIINNVLIELLMQYLLKHPELASLTNIPGISYFLMHGGSYAIMSHLLDPAPTISFDELADAIATMADSYAKQQLAS